MKTNAIECIWHPVERNENKQESYVNKQQTPKPDAHVPDAVPPLVPQSSSE